MKKMKTFWLDSNLNKILSKLFPDKNQGEFIRKSVEKSMELALKRIWSPIGYISQSSGHIFGTYCTKYFYGFYPKLKRQFVFIKDVEGTSFINMFPESKELLFNELSIMPNEEVDILFLNTIHRTVSIHQDTSSEIWNVLALDAQCQARDIENDYKAFVENYVQVITQNSTNYNRLRYFGVRYALGFEVDHNFEEVNHLYELTGHLDVVNLPDTYKQPTKTKQADYVNVDEEIDCYYEDDNFSCRGILTGGYGQNSPHLYFAFEFKKNDIFIYPGYIGWQDFCKGIANTIVSGDNKLKSVNFDSIYTIIDNELCIFRGMKFDMNITCDNHKLQQFIIKFLELKEYKSFVDMYESKLSEWENKNGKVNK